MVAAYRAETVFIRSCAAHYATEIGFGPCVEGQTNALGVWWPSLFQALRSGSVVWSDKTEADLVTSILIGADCDGLRLSITIRWSSSSYTLLITNVELV